MPRQLLFSNSTTKSWSFCETAFFNAALREGQGIEARAVQEDLLFGTVIHGVLPEIWRERLSAAKVAETRAQLERSFVEDGDWEQGLLPEARGKKAKEWGRLLEGMIWGIQRVVMPKLRGLYTLVMAEGDAVRWLPEWDFDSVDEAGQPCRCKVGLIAKPDTLLYPRMEVSGLSLTGEAGEMLPQPGVGYLEWKTVSSPNQGWQRHWVRNPQAWTGAMCVKASVGVEIEWFGVCGLVKGVERDGRRSSPFCYLYGLAPGMPTKVDPTSYWTTPDGWRWMCEYTAAKGWVRVETDAYTGGIEALCREMPMAIIAKQFVLTPPDDVDWELAEEWLENQRELVEAAAACGKEPERVREIFPRRLEKCSSGSYGGRACGFFRVCHDPEVAAEPLTVFRKRIPHHPLELGGMAGEVE